MPLKITIVYDNRCDNCLLKEGWGFSALIEFENSKILFDTGGNHAAFSSNAEKIQLPYNDITHVFFSHKHWDHITGFKEVLEKINKEAFLYLPKTFPWLLKRYGASCLKKTKVVSSFLEISPNIYSMVLRASFRLYEQVLILKTPLGLGVITGCAHPGILYILKKAREYLEDEIAFVVGGFHQFRTPAESTIAIVKEFEKLRVKKVAPCHCSGDHLIEQFKEAYGSNFFKIGTGSILNF